MEDLEDIKRIRLLHGVSKLIKLKLCRHGEADIYYIFDRKLPLRKLYDDYCKLENIAIKDVLMFYDGIRVMPHKCADELEMEDGDTIDVFHHQRGPLEWDIGRMRYLNLGGSNSNHIKLKLQTQGEDEYICYMLDRKCLLRKLFEDYCKMENFVYGTMRFLYDGTRLPADKCADDLEMENGDIIDVFFDQISG